MYIIFLLFKSQIFLLITILILINNFKCLIGFQLFTILYLIFKHYSTLPYLLLLKKIHTVLYIYIYIYIYISLLSIITLKKKKKSIIAQYMIIYEINIWYDEYFSYVVNIVHANAFLLLLFWEGLMDGFFFFLFFLICYNENFLLIKFFSSF